jgi:single-strand DNA-binding protein
MADGLNRVMLLGNLGADPELRMTSGGQAVLKLRLATAETYLDRNRNRQEKTEWHSVVVWGKRAEALGKILSKGSRLFVEGSLRTSSYDDRDGNKRYKTEIVAQNIILGGRGGGGGGRDSYDDHGGGGRDSGGGGRGGSGRDDSGSRDGGDGGYDDFEPKDSGGGFGGPPDDDDIPF